MSGDIVRVGVVGTTTYAQTHMTSISDCAGAALMAVAGRDRGRATTAAQRYGVAAVYDGYERMLESAELDAVVVIAPDELHEPIALAAFERGLHVLCEKPLATDPLAARRMTKAAADSGLVNMSYFALRTTAHHRLVKSLLDEGVIGPVKSASFSLAHGFFRSPAYNWRFDATHGGGVTADLGCYLFDLARWYVGEVLAVTSDGADHVDRTRADRAPYAPAYDSCVGLLRFAGGAHATFDASVVSTVGPGLQRNTVHLQGELGRIELTHTFAGASVRLAMAEQEQLIDMPLPDGFASPTGDAEFIDAILAGRPVTPAFEDGWRVQQIVAAAERAARSHTWVDISGED